MDEIHLRALHWFEERQGTLIPPPRQLEGTDLFLAQTAKAIHVPKQLDYALSVKIIPGGPYPDGNIEEDEQGRWKVDYHREDEAGRDSETLNSAVALRRCITDAVPIAVLRRTKPKPGPLYEVIGLGRVVSYAAPYFRIEGPVSLFEFDRKNKTGPIDSRDATLGEFDPHALAEAQARSFARVRRRQGQIAFRAKLLAAYGGECAISGCGVTQVLEAAHIIPYQGSKSNDVRNGLLLRADLHTLFDLNLLRIDPNSRAISISPSLGVSAYSSLHGQVLRAPLEASFSPNEDALRIRGDIL